MASSNSNPPYDLASAVSKLQSLGLGTLLDTFGIGRRSPGATNSPSSQNQQPEASTWLPGQPDFLGRLPFHPDYTGAAGQPSGEDGLITFRSGGGSRPPEMIENADGLLVSNPMALALRQRKEAGEEAVRQTQSEETDTLVDEFSRAKARKDAAWDQELAERSAQSAANFEADMQARGAQRSAPRRAATQRMSRTTRSRPEA